MECQPYLGTLEKSLSAPSRSRGLTPRAPVVPMSTSRTTSQAAFRPPSAIMAEIEKKWGAAHPIGRPDAYMAANTTAAKTGGTYGMADLVTHGTASKVTRPPLPASNAQMQIISHTEMTLPGDVLGPGADAESPVYDRMARIVRSRNLDVLVLIDDFLKRPAFSKMPTRNRAFVDLPTFRRALCYAFGEQWMRLGMTSAEFGSIASKYVRREAAHGSQATDVQGFGQPEALVMWQAFARDLMRFVNGESDPWSAETNDAAASRTFLDEFKKVAAAPAASPIGTRGAAAGQVRDAKRLIAERLMTKHATVQDALKDLDQARDGVISRREIKDMLKHNHLLR